MQIPFHSVLGDARKDEGSAGPGLKGLMPKVGRGQLLYGVWVPQLRPQGCRRSHHHRGKTRRGFTEEVTWRQAPTKHRQAARLSKKR